MSFDDMLRGQKAYDEGKGPPITGSFAEMIAYNARAIGDAVNRRNSPATGPGSSRTAIEMPSWVSWKNSRRLGIAGFVFGVFSEGAFEARLGAFSLETVSRALMVGLRWAVVGVLSPTIAAIVLPLLAVVLVVGIICWAVSVLFG
jgi:hypothetical protein